MSEQAWALVRAAKAAGKMRVEKDYADWMMRGRKGEPPSRGVISVLRFAPTHTAADILRALEEEGWELARVNEETPRAPRRPPPVDVVLCAAYVALLLRGARRGWAPWKIAACAWAAGERWVIIWKGVR
jgi:hypothetical protein